MRINHNISAMNTYRQYNTNTVSSNRSMEKLSSGLRINRAADDAAGLSISEKMRSQIRGLTQGTRNAQDGVSFIQTAEGALNEVSDMLTRLKELAVQVQNGTYSDNDAANIGAEMKALGTAITGIYSNTKFNGIEVFGAQAVNSGTMTDAEKMAANANYVFQNNLSTDKIYKISANGDKLLSTSATSFDPDTASWTEEAIQPTFFPEGITEANPYVAVKELNGTKYMVEVAADGTVDTNFAGLDTDIVGMVVMKTSGSATAATSLQGANGNAKAAEIIYGEDGNQVVTIKQADTTKLATLTGFTEAATDAAGAKAVSVSSVEDAIDQVNTTRAAYGALQNQLEHATNNMAATKENLQAAESRIRDVDMADEMMEFTKNNILVQAAQAMLAQANSQPQGILQLLR